MTIIAPANALLELQVKLAEKWLGRVMQNPPSA